MEEPTETTTLTQHTDDGDDDAADTGNDNQVFDWNSDISQVPPPKGYQPPDGTDRTNPFEQGAASTPVGEHIPLVERTRFPQEQQGPRNAETSFNEGSQSLQAIAEGQQESIWEEIGWDFPNVDRNKLDVRRVTAPRSGQGRGGAVIELSMKGRNKWYRFYTKSLGDTEATFNEHLPQEIKNALGKTRAELRAEAEAAAEAELISTNAALARKNQELAEKQAQLKRAAERAAESQKLKRDMDALTNQIKDVDAQIQQLEDEHGPLNEEAIQKLKDDKRKWEGEKQTKRQELSQLQKLAKQADEIRKDVDQLMRDKGKLEARSNELRAKKDTLTPLDDLKKEGEELAAKITEDKDVIKDENTSSSEREAAQARVTENEARLARLTEEVEVRERQRPLLERVKEIFKKYGWTLQAVALAVGVVLSALALAGLNGLKAGTKAVGRGLKTIGQKLGSLLPGLIGSIASFIFKAAGQVFSFLAEHAWLLILAVVAFFMERLLKRRRR